MHRHPGLSNTAVLGSTVRNRDVLTAWRTRQAAELSHAVRTLAASFAPRRDKLVTPDVTASVRAITDEAQRAWEAALPTTAGRADQMTRVNRDIAHAADQALRREVPEYAAITALEQEYRAAFRKLIDEHSGRFDSAAIQAPGWVEANVDSFGLAGFEPPFDVFDLFTSDVDNHIISNFSTVLPSQGFVVNDITYRHQNTWSDIARYNPFAFSDASVGVDFTAPHSGVLKVAVSMRNFYQHVHMSGGNDWGFSSADLRGVVSAMIVVLRDDTRIYTFHTTIEEHWVNPGGVSFSYTFPEFPPGPAVFVASVDEALQQGDQVQILGGCHTYVYSEVKNMKCRVSATQWWQVDKLWVWLE